jgi:hypothetical protein
VPSSEAEDACERQFVINVQCQALFFTETAASSDGDAPGTVLPPQPAAASAPQVLRMKKEPHFSSKK